MGTAGFPNLVPKQANPVPAPYFHSTINGNHSTNHSQRRPLAATVDQNQYIADAQRKQAEVQQLRLQKQQDDQDLRNLTTNNNQLRLQLQQARQAEQGSAQVQKELDLSKIEVARANGQVTYLKQEHNVVTQDLRVSQNHNGELEQGLKSLQDECQDHKQKYEELKNDYQQMEKELEEFHISHTVGTLPEHSTRGVRTNSRGDTYRVGASGLTIDATILVDVYGINKDFTVKRIGSYQPKAGVIYERNSLLKNIKKNMYSSGQLTKLQVKDRAEDLMVAWNLADSKPMAWSVVSGVNYEKWMNAVQAVRASHQTLAKKPEIPSAVPHDEDRIDGQVAVFFASKDKQNVMRKAMDDLRKGELQFEV